MVNLTLSTKPIKEKEIKREWVFIDLSGKTLGRIVPSIAHILQGKNKTNYVPYLDMGDYIVAVNAKKIVVTGKKSQTKIYSQYSGYPGGLKQISYEILMKKNPTEIIYKAVSGMLPKNKLRDQRLKRLFVFADDNHPYENKFKNLNPKS